MTRVTMTECGLRVEYPENTVFGEFHGSELTNLWNVAVSVMRAGSIDEFLLSGSYEEYRFRCSVSNVRPVLRKWFGLFDWARRLK